MSAIVFKGNGKDVQGWPCQFLEDNVSGQRFVAYEPGVWAEKVRVHNELLRLQREEKPSGRDHQAAD